MAVGIKRSGTPGNDTLKGYLDDDDINGGGGADLMYGLGGNDRIDSGFIWDAASQRWKPDDKGDLLDGGDGNDQLLGGAADDTLIGGAGDDRLHGSGGRDLLQGGAGNDILQSGKPYDPNTQTFGVDNTGDVLEGGDGDDQLYGEDGNDTLDGGSGSNLLAGGLGDDSYIVRSELDTIWDTGGKDKGIIYADWFRPSGDVENWTWAPGVQRLPNWIASLATGAPEARVTGQAHVVYYHFAQQPADFFDEEDRNGFQPFNQAQRDFTRKTFDYISSVLNVQFRETSALNGEDVLVMANNLQTTSSGYANARILMLGTNSPTNLAPTETNYAVSTLLHELGHSLGLKHPFGHEDADGDIGQDPYLSEFEDAGKYTLMSYNTEPTDYHLHYNALDLAALQYLYGPAKGVAAGDTVWALDAGQANFIADGSGIDTINASAFGGGAVIDLRPGYWGYLGQQADSIVKAGQVTVNFGTVVENLVGGTGNDRLTGNEAANRIAGGAGDDTLSGGAGSDILEGGAGQDVATYTGKFADFKVKVGKDGSTVTDGRLPADVDTLTGIERLKFDDVTVSLDIEGAAGQAFLLYQAAFNRTPDLGGLGYWIGRMETGTGLLDVAASFIASPEFVGMYGAKPSNSDFLNNLYKNILHRAPDPGGFDYWLKVLDGGANPAAILAEFSQSPENKVALTGVLEAGIAFTPFV